MASKRNIFDVSHFLFSEAADDSHASLIVSNLPIIGGVSFDPSAPPFLVGGKVFGSMLDPSNFEGAERRKEVEEYTIQPGDTLNSLAEQFGISIDSVAFTNNLSKTSALTPGKKLIILPVSGMLHLVSSGDTVGRLAALYQAKAEDIIEVNGLSDENKIAAGDMLVIPGGKKPKVAPSYVTVPLSNSYFIFPVPSPAKISQGLHWFNAVDFNTDNCGDPVFAVAGGIVQRSGFEKTAGNYVRIMHPNGVVTFYGHLSTIAATAGDKVSQGQIIGYIGHTGLTIPDGPDGCHLHFDVRFAENPFAR